MRIACSVRNDGPAETDGATREQGRFSLRKGEGEGEGLPWEKRWLRDSTPHLNPLPCKGRGERVGRLSTQ
jgi:hypothetical protein